MARIIDAQSSGSDASGTENHIALHADAEGGVTLPQGVAVGSLELNRDGQDLVLTAPDGRVLVVEDYFMGTTPPHITSADGAQLSPQLVQSFLTSAGDVRVAANEQMNDASPVGEVSEVSGAATVIRADGTRETITLGTDINQGDIIETAENGAVNIKFSDDSSFAISQNARLAIDEYSFNAADQSGSTSLSVLRGVFMFTSGLIGRENPDQVHLETPVGSIGIRGTIIGGHIAEAGSQSQISVIEGAIVVRNGTGEQILSSQFETVQLNSYNSEIKLVGVLDTVNVTKSYGAVRSVTPTLFSSIDDTARDQTPKKEVTPQNNQPTLNTEKPEPEERPQSQNDTPRDPVMMQTVSMDTMPKVEMRAENTDMRVNMTDNKIRGLALQNVMTKESEWLQQPEVRDMRKPSSLQFASAAHVDENATSGTAGQIVQVKTQANVSYSFAPGGDVGGLFVIDSQTGLITLNGTVGDYEAPLRAYNITVRATNTDNGRFTDTALSIGVNDENEAPTLLSYGAGTNSILENTASGTSFKSLNILNDLLINDAYTFKVYDNGIETNDFQVIYNAASARYELATNGALNYETKSAYNLSVGLTEGTFAEIRTGTQTFTILDDAAPSTVNNRSGLQISEGASHTLSTGDLKHRDFLPNGSERPSSQIIYTVEKTKIVGGALLGATDQGDYFTFTQAQINSGITISFSHDGTEDNASFSYKVSDGHETTGLQIFNFTNLEDANDTATKLETNGNEADLKTIADISGGMPPRIIITKEDLGYADSDGAVFYKFATPANGKLQKFNGSIWEDITTSTQIYQIEINNGKFAYEPPSGAAAGDTFTFNFSVFDSKFTGSPSETGTHTVELIGSTTFATDFNFNNNAGFYAAAGGKAGAYLGILNDNSATTIYDEGHYRIISVSQNGDTINPDNFEIISLPDGRIALKAKDTYTTSDDSPATLTFNIGLNLNKDATLNDKTNSINIQLRQDTITLEDLAIPESTRGFTIKGANANDKTGTAVAMADVNHDGKFDILTGSVGASSGKGILSLHRGGETPAAADPYLTNGGEDPRYKNIINTQSNAKYGAQIAVLGHFDTSYSDGKDDDGNPQTYFDPNTQFTQNLNRNYVDIATAAPGVNEIRIDSFFVNAGDYFQLRDSYTIKDVPTNASKDTNSIMLSSAGDVNGDGFDDLLIGTQFDAGKGSATLIYGSASRNAAGGTTEVSWTDAINPITGRLTFSSQDLTGRSATVTSSGASVAGLGDINRDGYSDFAVASLRGSSSSITQGLVNIFFGETGTNLDINDDAIIRGSNSMTGFANKIAMAGDINSNGHDDLFIQDLGQNSVWLVDGTGITKGMNDLIDGITQKTEIRWDGTSSNYIIGQVMANAGNFNGDEFDDYIISASREVGAGLYEHTLFVVYGEADTRAQINLSHLINQNQSAYKIKIAESSSLDITATGGGDINGDGYDDIIVGTPSAFDNNGTSTVIYGNNSSAAVSQISLSPVTGIGNAYRVTANNQSLVGTSSDDIFYNAKDGAGEYDGHYNGSVMGGAGNDTYIIENEDFLIDGISNYMFKKFDGGGGIDTLKLIHNSSADSPTDILDLTGISDHMFNVERIELLNSALQSDKVTLSLKDVLTLISDSDKLTDTGFKRFDIVLDGSGGTPPTLEINGFSALQLANLGQVYSTSGKTEGSISYTAYSFSVGELWVQNSLTLSTATAAYTDY